MPITLEKLFSATVSSSFPYMGETVHMTWAPARYTGEMADFAEKMDTELQVVKGELDDENEALVAATDQLAAAETPEEKAAAVRAVQAATAAAMRLAARAQQKDRKTVRQFLSQLLVSWDVMDGKTPYPTDEVSLAKLDPEFVATAYLSLGKENEADPPKPDLSNGTHARKASPAPSRRGTRSSGGPTTSGSRRGK